MTAVLSDGRARLGGAVAAVAAWLGGSVACVETGPRMGARGATCDAVPVVPYSGVAVIPSEDGSLAGPYVWKNVVIKGGGFVSGIVTSPVMPGLLFARTDVGGAYRFDPQNRRWWPLTDWIGHEDANLSGIESIAADPVDPNRVYIAAGTYLTAGPGAMLRSTDMGQTWSRFAIAAPMGGNVDGRSMGERLAVDPNLPTTLYFGSRNTGLWKSSDSAETWTQVATFPTTGALGGGAGSGGAGTGYGLTLVALDAQSGVAGSATPIVYIGVGRTESPSLFRSVDAGATWEAVAGQPTGMMPHHAVFDGCGNVYFAYNNGSGPNGITKGGLWRLAGKAGTWTDVTPPGSGGGFGGISADRAHPGTLVATTIDRWAPDEIYRTTNGGTTWIAIGGRAARDDAGAKWLWWHSNELRGTGWMGDVEIDPFNPDRALHITGQGIWSSSDLSAADANKSTSWRFESDGLEETVALDLVSPPDGASLLSGVGDIAGFRHDDLDISPAAGMYANPIFGNTSSLDFAERTPSIVARVGTASSTGGARGAYSTDGGTTWMPFAAAPATGNGAGTIAVSADGATFVWSPQRGTPSYSRDNGATWTACAGLDRGARIAADRVNASRFYASSATGVLVSADGGATFTPVNAPFAGRPRPVFGVEGDVWIATSAGVAHSRDGGASWTQLPQVGAATAIGFGMAAPGRSYPAVFLSAQVNGTWGIYRSDNVADDVTGTPAGDTGATWQRIDDPQHQFGYINCLAGDPRRFGRVYLGTSGRGILYGDPANPNETKR